MNPATLGSSAAGAASIRAHLLILVLAVSLPLTLAVGYGIYNDMQQTVAHTKASLRTLAMTMVSSTGGKIAYARQTLERLAARPLVKKVDSKNCDAVLTELHAFNPGYANVTYTDLNGLAVCSAVPQPGGKPVNVGKEPWFQRLMKERRFTVGQPFFGPITGRWVSVVSAPIWNHRQEMVGGVEIPLDLKSLEPTIPTQFLPKGSRYGISTEDGILIWRNLDPEVLMGTHPKVPAWQQGLHMRDGEFETQGYDGVRRFYSAFPMPETGWIAWVGVPASAIYAEARERALTETAIAIVVLAGLLLTALAIARRIASPIVELEKTAQLIHAGNLEARATVGGPSEVTAVAQKFNAMVTGLQLSQEKLRQSELRHKETEKIGKVGGWEFQIETGKQTWTEETYDIHELDLSYEPTVETGISFYTPASRPVIEQAMRGAVRGVPFNVELEINTAKDNVRSILAIGIPDLEHRRVFGFFQDITERKQAEMALKESKDQFKMVVEQSPLAMALVCSDGKIEYINQKAIETFGYLPLDIPNMDSWWALAYPDQTYRAEVIAKWTDLAGEALAHNHEIQKSDYHVTCKNGNLIIATIFGVWINDKVLVIFEDITERKQQEQLRIKKERAHRDSLVREVHHRIKNNLQSVAGLLQRELGKFLELEPRLETAISQINVIAIVHGLQSADPSETVSLYQVVQNICKTVSSLAQRQVLFNTAQEEAGLRQIDIENDEAVSVALVLNELILNAVKHSPPGSAAPTVTLGHDGGGAQLVIRNAMQGPPDFDIVTGMGLGTGLSLVRSLLPEEGAELSYTVDAAGFMITHLKLAPSVVVMASGDSSVLSETR